MPLPLNAVIAVNFPASWQQQRYLLTTTWRVAGTESLQSIPDDVSSIAFHFSGTGAATVRGALRACLGNNVLLMPPRAQEIFPVRSLYAIGTTSITGSGPVVADSGNLAAVISCRTNFAGRSQIANKHIGPLYNSSWEGGAPIPAMVTLLETLAIQLTSGQVVDAGGDDTIDLLPVIFHRSNNTYSDITNFIVSDRMGTMRRRTLRVGE